MEIATNATLVMVFSLHFSVAACKLFVYRDWLVLGEFFFYLAIIYTGKEACLYEDMYMFRRRISERAMD